MCVRQISLYKIVVSLVPVRNFSCSRASASSSRVWSLVSLGLVRSCRVTDFPALSRKLLNKGGPVTTTSVAGVFFSKMDDNGKEKDPAEGADPVLLEKARTKPKEMTEEEWQTLLTPHQYDVARGHGTERPWTGRHSENKEIGLYRCVCCNCELFPSETKYESGSGWPSFYDTCKQGNGDNVERKSDQSHGMRRTEVLCKRCNAHLGHVFTDGPEPTGLRYCINSAALRFQKKD